jgi:hypothetical protein
MRHAEGSVMQIQHAGRKRRTSKGAVLALSLALGLIGAASAQDQQTKWEQTLNIPKGAKMPSGVKAEILGVELGDSFADAKAKLEKLASEGLLKATPAKKTFEQQVTEETMGVRNIRPYLEERAVFRFQQPGTQSVVTAGFVKKVIVERVFKGSGNANWNEKITVWFSAPSSGHQVIGIERGVYYHAANDQPRISEVLADLSKKFRSEPQISGTWARFQFDDGKPQTPSNNSQLYCRAYHMTAQAKEVSQINPKGDCDILLQVRLNKGISPDHASDLTFVLSDNDRTKANLEADFTFLQNQVRKFQDTTRGEKPKL